MGTDIHLSWQIRKNGKWEVIPLLKDSDGDKLLDHRDYDNFALIADVRNGFGFAGVKTGEAVQPIAPNRGFPSDMAGIEDYEVDEMPEETAVSLYQGFIYGRFGEFHRDRPDAWLGEHSFTWMSLRDLLEYPRWDSSRQHQGVVRKEEAERLIAEGGVPDRYCAAVYGRDSENYVLYKWETPLTDSYVYKEVIPAMRRLADDNGVGPDDVRVVMGFDS